MEMPNKKQFYTETGLVVHAKLQADFLLLFAYPCFVLEKKIKKTLIHKESCNKMMALHFHS